MEIAFSAFVGELAHRSISFFIEKLCKEEPTVPMEESLRRKLLRVHVVVEEAEGRQITSQAMLEQLKLLREGMHRGYYVLDNFRYRAYQQEENSKDYPGLASHSFALSMFNPAKRVQLCGGSSRGERELQQVLSRLEIIVTDTSEFVMLLQGCPRLYRQPYSTYLLMEKCMFGRHVEMEHIINFLLQMGPPGAANLDILPILGPAKAGKSTLIEHVCNDERVRTAFSRIVLFTEDDLEDGRRTSVKDGRIIKQEIRASKKDKILVIVELDGDIDEGAWRRLYSAYKSYAANSSKIIISSRSNKIARFGTTRALRVQYLTPEAYWYFFKALAFGSTDPEEEPKLASVAMEIAADLNGSFIAGNIIASMLRANFSAKFWAMARSSVRECRERYPFMFGAQPVSPWQLTKQARVRRIDKTDEYCSISNDYQIVSAQDEAPMIKMQEVLSGSVRLPDGKFQALAWKSPIPPHYSYVFSCEMQKTQRMVVRKKRFQKIIH